MKVLLAIDGSKFSDAATQALISQINAKNADVLVLHVLEPLTVSVPPEMAAGYAPEQEPALKEKMSEARATSQVLQKAGFKATSRVVVGEIRISILDAATQWGADLIVLGSHGRKGLQRFLLGSVAESVARNAQCSVLIVRTRPESAA